MSLFIQFVFLTLDRIYHFIGVDFSSVFGFVVIFDPYFCKFSSFFSVDIFVVSIVFQIFCSSNRCGFPTVLASFYV